MTRLSLELENAYPRKFVWWMECDTCHETRSRPAWIQQDLPLTEFAEAGWDVGKLFDVCPACLLRERTDDECPECGQHYLTIGERPMSHGDWVKFTDWLAAEKQAPQDAGTP